MPTIRARTTAFGLLAAGALAVSACHELPGPGPDPDPGPGPASLVASPVPLVLQGEAGGPDVTGVVTITNEGDTATGPLFTGGPSSPRLTVDDDCAGQSLAPDESCTIEVTFDPPASGTTTVAADWGVWSASGASTRVEVEASSFPPGT